MSLKDRIRCFLTFRFPLGFYRRNYEGWKEVLPEEMQELNSSDYLLLASEKKTTSGEVNETNKTFIGSSEQLDVSDDGSEMVEASSNLNAENSRMVILLEKSFMKRNGVTVLRLLFQSFALSFAVSFSLSFPALLQIIPLEFRLSLIKILSPLSFVLEPVIQMYDLLRYLSSFVQGYDPAWLYVLAGEWFLKIAKLLPFLPELSEDSVTWQWKSRSGEIDEPVVAPQQQYILGKLYKLIPNQWIGLFLLWLLTSVPLFFFLSYRFQKQVIELMPNEVYMKNVERLRKIFDDCLGIVLLGVKKNRLVDEHQSLQVTFLKYLRFLSRYGVIFSFVFPILLGIVFALL